MILLDTHAAIWLAANHRRARPLRQLPRLYISPATVLEIQFLLETGRIRLAGGRTPASLADEPLWRVDEPPVARWFAAACDCHWTRDPFDRLLAAHVRVRGWKLATADDLLLTHLPPSETLPL